MQPFHGKSLVVCDVVRHNRHETPVILRASQGYVAPDSWYEPDPNYIGVAKSLSSQRGVPDESVSAEQSDTDV